MGPELFNKMRPYLGDEKALMDRMAGRMDLWEECVLLFPREEILQEMEAAVKGEDYGALYASVHKLKGNLANFGFDTAAEMAIKLLDAIKTLKYAEVKQLHSTLAKTYTEMIERIGEVG